MKNIWYWLFNTEEDKELLEKKKLRWEIKSSKIKTTMFLLALFAEIVILYFVAKSYGLIEDSVVLGKKIAVIDFNKEVTQTYVNTIIKSLEKAKKDKDYKEVLFIMNSPGGSPTASDELSEYLKDYQTHKPLTMYIQGIAASGGYYIASAIKPLYSNKNAIVGSIGVIMPHYNFGELAQKIGIEEDDLSAGEFKKPISFFKKLQPKEKAYLKKQILTPMYNNFIAAVALNRELNITEVEKYAEGKVYMANNPDIQNILIDKIISLITLKNRIKKRYNNSISFVNILPKDPIGLLGSKIEFNLNLDKNLMPTLK